MYACAWIRNKSQRKCVVLYRGPKVVPKHKTKIPICHRIDKRNTKISHYHYLILNCLYHISAESQYYITTTSRVWTLTSEWVWIWTPRDIFTIGTQLVDERMHLDNTREESDYDPITHRIHGITPTIKSRFWVERSGQGCGQSSTDASPSESSVTSSFLSELTPVPTSGCLDSIIAVIVFS